MDLFILYKLQQVKKKILHAYKEFEYHIIYHAISNFFTNDLSSLLLTAPILSFTTEEAWAHIPPFKGKEDSIHLHLLPKIEEKYFEKIDENKWEKILNLRDNILKEIEDARGNQKTIGDSLEAEINLDLPANLYDLVSEKCDLFQEILVVSKIHIKKSKEEKISVNKSKGNKCPRCWNWFTEGTSSELCSRCADVIGD